MSTDLAMARNGRPSGPPHSEEPHPLPADRFGGYNAFSLALHWLSAAMIAMLLAALVAGRGELHASLTILAAPIVLFGATWRLLRGFARPADLPAALCLMARLLALAMLIASIALALSGLAMPLAGDGALTLFGQRLLTAPWPADAELAARLGRLHGAAGAMLVAGAAVHLVLAGAHAALGLHAINRRPFTPVRGGR